MEGGGRRKLRRWGRGGPVVRASPLCAVGRQRQAAAERRRSGFFLRRDRELRGVGGSLRTRCAQGAGWAVAPPWARLTTSCRRRDLGPVSLFIKNAGGDRCVTGMPRGCEVTCKFVSPTETGLDPWLLKPRLAWVPDEAPAVPRPFPGFAACGAPSVAFGTSAFANGSCVCLFFFFPSNFSFSTTLKGKCTPGTTRHSRTGSAGPETSTRKTCRST